MIVGEYPCCGGTLALAMPDGPGGYAPRTCEHCGATCWTRFSRLDPETWTDADFRREFDVDDLAKRVTPRANSGANPVRIERH